MDEVVSAADANRNFDELLRHVQEGHRYVVTSQGTPVAHIVPAIRERQDKAEAKERLMARLKSQPIQILDQRWSRDDLYES